MIARRGSIGYKIAPMDYSTIKLERLMGLPLYQLPPPYHLSDEPGTASAGDPPGFPSHLVWTVYTHYGDEPGTGPVHVLVHPDDQNMLLSSRLREKHGIKGDAHQARLYRIPDGYGDENAWDQALRPLWEPLPEGHERCRLWMRSVYIHFQHCYRHPTKLEYGKPGVFFWGGGSVPDAVPEGLEQFVSPENHLAVRSIRKFYPEHEPLVEWIANVKRALDGYEPNNRWWENCADSSMPSAEGVGQ